MNIGLVNELNNLLEKKQHCASFETHVDQVNRQHTTEINFKGKTHYISSKNELSLMFGCISIGFAPTLREIDCLNQWGLNMDAMCVFDFGILPFLSVSSCYFSKLLGD